LAVAVLFGCEPQATRGPEADAGGSLASPPETSARFRATIYEVRPRADWLGHLSADALAGSADSLDGLEKALADLGDTQVAYAIDQTIRLTEDRIHLGKRQPFVTNTRRTDGRGRINTIQYEDVGVIFVISGQRTDAGPDVKVDIEMSTMTEAGTEVAEGVSAMAVRQVVFGRSGPVRFGRPEVLVAADASAQNVEAGPVTYVCRVVFDRLKP
jgi:hypothetical protein